MDQKLLKKQEKKIFVYYDSAPSAYTWIYSML